MPLPKKRKVEHQHQEHQEHQKHQEHQEHQKHQEHQEHQEQQVRDQVRGQQVRGQQVRGQQVRGQEIPVPAKSIEKLISQNFKILSKLDTLISAQQLIDDRLKKIEGSSDESSSEEVIKTIVVEVARNLLKVSIYPSQNEFREETEKVLRSSFPELHKKFCQSPIFYEKNIYQPLLAKHRSFRGSLTSRIKDALYTIFPELPSITSNSPPSEIRQWKSNPIVASCHNKLFKKIVVEEPTTFMSKILDRLFPSKTQNIRCIRYKHL